MSSASHRDRKISESLARLRARRPRHLLFVCVANSARSQMAEGIARSLAPEGIEVSSGGSHPARVHRLAILAMEEIGLDIRHHWSKDVEEVDLMTVDAAVTLCSEEECPRLPPGVLLEHWLLPDPAATGSDPLDGFRVVRDELHRRISTLFREENE